jgi:hypothetical protein
VDISKATTLIDVRLSALEWMCIHGNLCLALRHPNNVGNPREITVSVAQVLARVIVESGLLTQAEMDNAHHVELEAAGATGRVS